MRASHMDGAMPSRHRHGRARRPKLKGSAPSLPWWDDASQTHVEIKPLRLPTSSPHGKNHALPRAHLLSWRSPAGGADSPRMQYDIVIIGGSLSGSAAATLLLRERPDLRVLVVERAPRFS